MGLEGTKARSEQFIRDEEGTLLPDRVRIRKRWSGFYRKLLNTISLKLDPTILDLLPPRPLELSLGDGEGGGGKMFQSTGPPVRVVSLFSEFCLFFIYSYCIFLSSI